ncbi:MAG: hypothetical protein DRI86_10110 [Bacteroidetes bacterium]|nr:MAG: hypothetical protein DRI86_10110 [Bacteroidota bacterium]
MKKIYFIIAVLAIIASSCQKEADSKVVDYMITGLADPYSIVYLDDNGNSVAETITPNGLSDKWIKSFSMDEGSPIYLYIKFTEDISSNMSFNMGVLINGKYYKQAKHFDKESSATGTLIFEVKRSGIVPFE